MILIYVYVFYRLLTVIKLDCYSGCCEGGNKEEGKGGEESQSGGHGGP